MRLKKIYILVFVMLLPILFLYGCNKDSDNNKSNSPPVQPQSYSISYILDGGTVSENPTTFSKLEDLKNLHSPSKNNNNFIGWYLDSNFEISLESLNTMPDNNITLYAKWYWYDIDTPNDFINIKSNCNYRINNDLDMSGINGYTPIGNKSSAFSGTIEGNGYSINNLSIYKNNEGYIGLFGNIKSATIKNLNIKNLIILSSSGEYVGALSGKSSNSNIESVSLSNIDINVSNRADSCIGGFIGYSYKDSIYKCRITGGKANNKITYTNTYKAYGTEVGGFIGDSYSTINVCYAFATVKVDGGSTNNCCFVAGTFIGRNNIDGVINQVYTVGTVNTSTCTYATTGGFIGGNSGVVTNFFIDCFFYAFDERNTNTYLETGMVIARQSGVVSNGYRYTSINVTYPYATNFKDISLISDSTYMKNTMKFTDLSWNFETDYYPYF